MMPKNTPPENEIAAALAACRGAFFSVGAFSAIINLLMLAPSLYMLQVYDRVLASRNETTLLVLTLLVLAVSSVRTLFEQIQLISRKGLNIIGDGFVK